MMHDWQDLRFFLAVHREGSLAAAGARLRVSPTTVSRRISSLESALGQPVFLRGRGQWSLSPLGARILPAAERVEAAAREVQLAREKGAWEPEGTVRLSTLDVVGTRLVAPRLPSLYERYPRIRVDIVCSPVSVDLQRGEADLALRSGAPRGPEMLARRVSSPLERPYATRAFLEQRGVPAGLTRIEGLPVLVLYGDESWVFAQQAHLALRTSSSNVLLAATLAGTGLAILPDVLARPHPELVPLEGLNHTRERSLWLVMHRDMASVPAVRAVADFLADIPE